MIFNFIVYILSFVLIWFGAGLIISSIDNFSRKLKISSFAISFVLLGILTSAPEFSVGLQAIANNNPNVFVGNLIGGIPVIFLFVTPILAIFGNGVTLKHDFDKKTLLAVLGVCVAPVFLTIDHHLAQGEGVVLIFLYAVVVLLVQRRRGVLDSQNTQVLDVKAYSPIELLKIIIGIGIVFGNGRVILDQTLYFANAFNVSPFFISLIALSVGTNLPELSLAIRSIASRKKDIAFGDYLGSASANAFLFGLFIILYGKEIIIENNFLITFSFIVGGLIMFYLFSSSQRKISRFEGVILLLIYFMFIGFEIYF